MFKKLFNVLVPICILFGRFLKQRVSYSLYAYCLGVCPDRERPIPYTHTVWAFFQIESVLFPKCILSGHFSGQRVSQSMFAYYLRDDPDRERPNITCILFGLLFKQKVYYFLFIYYLVRILFGRWFRWRAFKFPYAYCLDFGPHGQRYSPYMHTIWNFFQIENVLFAIRILSIYRLRQRTLSSLYLKVRQPRSQLENSKY